MGWFWASSSNASGAEAPLDQSVIQHIQAEQGRESRCPVDHHQLSEPAPSKCPVDHTKLMAKSESKCPVDHTKLMGKSGSLPAKTPEKTSRWWFSRNNDEINPNNMMPDLTSQKAPGQKLDLPTERTLSSIPKGTSEEDGVWEYPSPQQMLNAMLRKNASTEADANGQAPPVPEDAVESMVDVHNFLNEGAWDEILKWEDEHTQRLAPDDRRHPRLLKFQGRPNDMSPRAQMLQMLGKVYPSKYGTQAPFDRHDWTVLRPQTGGEWEKVRYVIDYYAGPDTDDGMPSFILDVRPALDSVQAGWDRFNRATNNTWARAMGWEK